jgi:hypothetical protein
MCNGVLKAQGQVMAFASTVACFVSVSIDVVISPITSVTEEEVPSFGMYPNPADYFISIRSSEQMTGLVILDSSGRLVREFNRITPRFANWP